MYNTVRKNKRLKILVKSCRWFLALLHSKCDKLRVTICYLDQHIELDLYSVKSPTQHSSCSYYHATGARCDLDRMVVGFITAYMQSVPVTTNVKNSNPAPGGLLDTTLYDKICQWLATGRWLSSGPPVSSINKTDRHDITKILLKVALNTITLTTFSIVIRVLQADI